MEPVSGESIAIAGPESDMKKIGKVIVEADVDGLKRNKTVLSKIIIYDKNEEPFLESQMERLTIKTLDGKVFEEDKMNVSVEIWKKVRGIIPDVEVGGTPADGYRVAKVTTAPETIGLAGRKAVLAELGNHLAISDQISVDGASGTFSKEINLKEYLEDQYGESLQLERGSSDIIVVTVQMEKIGTTTVQVPVANIVIKGKPENMTYKLTPADNISLEIQPKWAEEEKITADDIQVTLDLSSSQYQTPGNYRVPLTVVLPDGYMLTSEATIAVNLVKTEPAVETESQ